MKIFIDGRRNYGSGIGRVTSNLIEGFLEFDVENDYIILINKNDSCKKKSLNESGARVVECEIPFFSKQDLYELPKIISAEKADVFFSPQFYISPFIECPSIKMVHDMWTLLHPKWIPTNKEFISKFGKESFAGIIELVNFFKKHYQKNLIFPRNKFVREKFNAPKIKLTYQYMIAMMSLTLYTANKITTPSFHSQEEIIQLFPEVKNKVEVIPMFASPVFSSDGAKSKSNVLLHVSKWEPRKNLKRIIEAVNLVRESGVDCKLLIVGDKGYRKYGEDILNLISKSPYKDFVKLTGVIDDINLSELYRSSYIFLFPTLYEGFGIPIVEAMASGTPTITSNVTAMPEVSGNGAVLVSPKKVRDIARAIKKLLLDKKFYEEVRQRGFERIRNFDRKEIIFKYVSLIKEASIQKIQQI
ncbi:MAG: glycosyltransferase family 4 protein [Pyrinomonadaceae bacterium]